MKTLSRLLLLAAMTAALALPVLSVGPKPSEAKGAPKYDPAAEITVKGVVQEVKSYQCPVAGSMGAHLVLKTDKGLVEVHLGASKYLDNYKFEFAVGDQLEVVGAMAKVDDKDALLARTVTRGEVTFTFRDKKGKPLW